MTCQHCTAPTSNGLELCDLCQMKLATNLEFLPIYFQNLARWRPGSAGVRSVPGSREPGRVASGSDRVSRVLDEAGALIVGWALALEEDRPEAVLPASHGEASSVRVACLYLAEHLTTIATLEWAADIVGETTTLERRLRRIAEQVTPGWYAGACALCEQPTHVVPGLTWVTCQSCGAITYARDHLATVLDEARDWTDRPKALASAIVALLDTEQSVPRLHARIRQWGARSEQGLRGIAAVRRLDTDGDPTGPKRYRLGDVLDLLASEGQTRGSTRTTEPEATAS